MENSIFLTIKKMIGLDADYHAFDTDILADLNSTLTIVCQLGVGPKKPFVVTGESETWDDFFGENKDLLELTKSYIYQRVKLMFDPPSSGVLNEAVERQLKEYEWRLVVAVECDIPKIKGVR